MEDGMAWQRTIGGSLVNVSVVSGRLYFEDETHPRREVPYIVSMIGNTLKVAAGDGSHLAERVGDGMAACERAYGAASRERAAWMAKWKGRAKRVGVKLVPLVPIPMATLS
jgi:hypothetical protein